jgi:hypothetical protein
VSRLRRCELSSRNEEVLCWINIGGRDLVVTSKRIVLEKHRQFRRQQGVVDMFLGASPVFGWAAWDASGEVLAYSLGWLDRDGALAPDLIIKSIPLDEVASIVFRIPSSKPSDDVEVWLRRKGNEGVEELWYKTLPQFLVPLWNLMPTLLKGERRVLTDVASRKAFNFNKTWVQFFCVNLTLAGYPAKVVKFVKGDASKGLIELSGCNVGFVIKNISDLSPNLQFIVPNLANRIEGKVAVKVRYDKTQERAVVEFKGKDIRLMDLLNNDSRLQQSLRTLPDPTIVCISPFVEKSDQRLGDEKLTFEKCGIISIDTLDIVTEDLMHAADRIAYCLRTAAGVRT